jgi:threonine 3-dehydrogenase
MAVLVTGGAGFVAAQLVRQLLERGEKSLSVLDLQAPRRLADVADRISFHQVDLSDEAAVLAAVQNLRPREIFHLGGMLSVACEADPAAAVRVNVLGTLHILEAARQAGVPQVIYSSTLATYGSDLREKELSESTLQRPVFFYGATKLFGENAGTFYRRKFGLDFRGVRFPSVVGPGATSAAVSQYIPWMIEHAIRGDPFTANVAERTACPFMYYKDAAQALLKLSAAPAGNLKRSVYLVAGPKPVPTAGQLAELVHQRFPKARITFAVDDQLQAMLDQYLFPVDDCCAAADWAWQAQWSVPRMIEDFAAALGCPGAVKS